MRGYWLGPLAGWCRDAVSSGGRNPMSVAQLLEQNRDLRSAVVAAQRGTRTERKTREDLRIALQRLEAQLLDLKREVAFYRRVMASQARPGLRADSLVLAPLAANRAFHYRLVLTQFGRRVKLARGKAALTFYGMTDGKRARLALGEVATPPRDELDFHFRYFQSLEGDLVLPEGFQQLRVEVALKTAGEKSASVRRTFDWTE